MLFPSDAQKVQVEGATVDFYKWKEGDTTYYGFDTSKLGPPEPMVNAMAGLKLVDNPSVKLVMVNHKMPMGLLNKIGENFQIEKEELSDGRIRLIFGYKEGESEKADLSDSHCHG